MWQVFIVGFYLVISSLVMILFDQNVSASNQSWITNPVTKIAQIETEPQSDEAKTCGSRELVIKISGEPGYLNACVFGSSSGTKIARYQGQDNLFNYAVSFPSDGDYKRIHGLCSGLAACVYSQESDVFLLQVPVSSGLYKYAIIEDFTKYLKFTSGQFQFDYSNPYTFIRAKDTNIHPRSYGISQNGEWGVIEVANYGLIQINFNSMSIRRIASQDSVPQNTSFLDVTISNDGQWIAVTGEGANALVYKVTSSCGESIDIAFSSFFTNENVACKYATVPLQSLIPGFVSARTPTFSHDAARLFVTAQANNKTALVSLSSKVSENFNPFYLAFGDSFTSGEGEDDDNFYINGTNTSTNKCHVSSRSYPYLLGANWDVLSASVACSGSRIPDVQNASQKFQLSGNTLWPSTISVGIGGNDVDLIGKLKKCIGAGTCELAKEGNRQAAGYEIKELFPRMVNVIKELKADFFPASLFVVGYPSVINDQASANCSFLVGSMLSPEERLYISESIRYLNRVLKAAASYTQTRYANIETAYPGERLCDEKETAMNGIRTGDDIAPIPILGDVKFIGAESFHPTPKGHWLAANRIALELDEKLFWGTQLCGDCNFQNSHIKLSNYWWNGAGEGEGEIEDVGKPIVRQIIQRFLDLDFLTNVSNVAFKFLANTFTPNSIVTFELHSDVIQLGSFTASEDGSLSGVLSLPTNVDGYHTVHAYGENRSGEQINLYQTVAFGEIEPVAGLESSSSNNRYGDSALSSPSELAKPTRVASLQPNFEPYFPNEITNSTKIPAIKGYDISRKIKKGDSDNLSFEWFLMGMTAFGVLITVVSVLLLKKNNKSLRELGNR